MNNLYERGELKIIVNSKPSFRDLIWACENDAIILVPVPTPTNMPPHFDSYFAGWLDSLGFSEATEKQRSRIFVCIADNLEEYPDDVIVDKFLLGIKINGAGFIKSLQGDKRGILIEIMNKIPDGFLE